MSRQQNSKPTIPSLTHLPPLSPLFNVACFLKSDLTKWSPEERESLKKEMKQMLETVKTTKAGLEKTYNTSLRIYKPSTERSEVHTRQKTHQQEQNAVKIPEPIICVPNEQARKYWDEVVFPYVRYPTKDDYDQLLESMDETPMNIDISLGEREEYPEYSIREKLADGIVNSEQRMITENDVEDDEVIKRMEECGIISRRQIQNINPRGRKDDEISRELRRMNRELAEKKRFINDCKRKMREYYEKVKNKRFEFEGLASDEKKYCFTQK